MTFYPHTFKDLIDYQTDNFDQVYASIYIPTYRAGNAAEDRIRFKNALSDAGQQLITYHERKSGVSEFDKKEAYRFLKHPYNLLEDNHIWSHLSDGLAAFIGEDFFEYYPVPVSFNSFSHVGGTFYLRHLLPQLSGEDKFFLLALSQGEVRFFEVHRNHIYTVKIDDLVPNNIEEALMYDREPALQFHSIGSGSAIYHGQGINKDTRGNDLRTYFRQIDSGLMKMLHDEHVPMIIAGVDYLIPMYREVNSYPYLMYNHIGGNPEQDNPIVLHEKAWQLMDSHFERKKAGIRKRFRDYFLQNRASSDLRETVLAAHEGRIDTLFVDKDIPLIWGKPKLGKEYTVEMHHERKVDSICLLEFAALETWKNGGTVFNVSRKTFPDTAAVVNAIMRY